MKNSVQLHEIGQSFWLDNIDRRALINGEMEKKVHDGIVWGVTSNPSIFQKAITSSHVYQSHIQAMSWLGLNTQKIYEELVIRDIRDTADILIPVYEITGRKDGYVSIEVDPDLADKAEETAAEAERLWKLVDRPNVMIKIPATDAGIFAIRETIGKGINVNITLIFSVNRYREVIDAYFSGLERRIASSLEISGIHSVASFFISRIDSKVDKIMEDMIKNDAGDVEKISENLGKAAISNALMAYEEFQKSIATDRYKSLQENGANTQRPLWASTSTKNPNYSDILYVQELVLPDTVNTMPDATLLDFLDHGEPKQIDYVKSIEKARDLMDFLRSVHIDLEKVTNELEREGVEAFSASQEKLLEDIESLRARFVNEISVFTDVSFREVKKLQNNEFTNRLCAHDVDLWPADEAGKKEIANRLDWLEAPLQDLEIVQQATALREELIHAGFTHTVVLGMGGSSLAPEVFGKLARAYGITGGLDLSILDSTSPDQVLAKRNEIPLDKTIFFVSSKSGGTSEMDAAYRYFWHGLEEIGVKNPGSHFIAITDPGTTLEKLADEKKFRKCFRANPNVGGRYSALIEFGLIPAAIAGIDGEKLLRTARNMMVDCSSNKSSITNPGILLGTLLATAYAAGRDKLTIIADNSLVPIGAWIEQLIAESSGKEGKGILPVADEPLMDPEKYGNDRFFVYLNSDNEHKQFVDLLETLGHPVINFPIDDIYQLGAEFYRWEMATATACSIIEVNAFDQPNVQLSKSITKGMISEYKKNQVIREGEPMFSDNSISIFSEHLGLENLSNASSILREFLGLAGEESYIAINAFVERNEANAERLQSFRRKLIESTGLATTLGFGPRFLHSTGQLHKGGKNNGLFILITVESSDDLDIPSEGMTFGTLLMAQAIGDMRALQQQNRRVLRIHFHGNSFEKVDLSELI
jgi:transaldolase/glucose-6-phosphate isomerase